MLSDHKSIHSRKRTCENWVGSLSDQYIFQQRAQWHQKPWFEKLEPRPALRMVYNFTPYILPNVAFVSCASSGNYDWLVELLESIQATQHYSTIPHCIVDIGLSNAEKNYLTTHFPVHAIKKPDMIYFPKRTLFNEGSRANNCYPFFHEIFPKFEYLCHIETDMWVQEESVFHDIFTLAKHQGFALANLNTVYIALIKTLLSSSLEN